MGSKARIVASTAYIVSASIPIRSMQQGLRPCPACICFCSPSEQHPLSHCYQSQKFYATWNPPNRDDLMPPRLSHWGGAFLKEGGPRRTQRRATYATCRKVFGPTILKRPAGIPQPIDISTGLGVFFEPSRLREYHFAGVRDDLDCWLRSRYAAKSC